MQLHIIIIVLGSNAIVSYVVLGISPPGQMAFTINSSTGVITKDFALDRETIDQYILTIQVCYVLLYTCIIIESVGYK